MNDKSYIIQKMFNQIAKNYDLMNYIMSFGNHKKWEKEIIKSVSKKNMKIHKYIAKKSIKSPNSVKG